MNILKKGISLLLCGVMITSLLAGCGQKNGDDKNYIDRQGFALNTTINIRIYESTDEDILTECMIMCNDYDDMFSRTKENSEIYELNKNKEADVSRETLELIQQGIYYGELSNGAFDITIEPVSSLWDFTSGEGTVPDSDLIKEKLKYVNYKDIQIDGNHVTLKEGMGIDLGAIAKGYIADRLKDYLLEQGITSAIINLGGNVLCVGTKPSGEDIQVGIRDPRNEGALITSVSAADQSVVTSGDYERFIEVDGKRYCHILDPNTGYSCESGVESVTIISDTSVQGDGLSTTCFALGIEDGLALINGLDHVEAIFVDLDGNLVYSDGLNNQEE